MAPRALLPRLGLGLFAATAVQADLPVHCLRTEVQGKWVFHLGEVSDRYQRCGHRRPDVETAEPPVEATVGKVTRSVDVDLLEVNKATVSGTAGNWTMIYDEGFFVETPDERFFAFSKFLLSESNEANASKEARFAPMVHGKKVFRSQCGSTEVGWYHDKRSKKWGCYYGVKQVKDPLKFTDHLSFLALPGGGRGASTPLMRSELEDMAKDLNTRNLGWTASSYAGNFEGRTLRELNRRAGILRYSLMQAGEGSTERRRVSFLNTRSTIATEPSTASKKARPHPEHLPKEFSWRNVSGANYLDPAMDQQDCGSCYVVSAVRMLSARYRIHKKNTHLPAFSIDLPLYCAEQNQGCDGGYPSLVSMWSGNVGLVPDRCAGPYFASETQSCGDMLKHRPKFLECTRSHQAARVESWGYVGGYYGGCSEEAMMEELHRNGPIVVSLEPASDFMFYQKGIYRGSHATIRPEVPWLKVDHAVLCVGWGTETVGGKEHKYWILQNSWGRDWGEGGYMRIARGEDESGVEFQAVGAKVEDMTNAERDATMTRVWEDALGKHEL